MNKILIAITGLTLVLSTFSCRKNSNELPKDQSLTQQVNNQLRETIDYSDSTLLEMFAEVGILHNSGLDAIYTSLFEYKNLHGTIDSSMIQALVYQFAKQYSKSLNDEYNDYEDSTIRLNELFFSSLGNLSSIIQNNDIENFLEYEFSNAYIHAIGEVLSISDDSTMSLADKSAAWSNCLNNYLSYIDNQAEKGALICAINTAKATHAYWSDYDNANKWYRLYNETDLPDGGLPQGKLSQDAKNDIQGAAAGAGGFLLSYGSGAAAFGPGAVAAVGLCGAVHGACKGTAGAVLWDTFWNWLGV